MFVIDEEGEEELKENEKDKKDKIKRYNKSGKKFKKKKKLEDYLTDEPNLITRVIPIYKSHLSSATKPY